MSAEESISILENVPNYRFYKYVIYVAAPLLILYVTTYFINSESNINFKFYGQILPAFPPDLFKVNFDNFFVLFLILLNQLSLVVIVPPLVLKDYNFYIAKRYFEKTNSDIDEKFKYVRKGLKEYNTYLKRNVKLQIGSINKISSIIICDSNIKIEESIHSISQSFKIGDGLSPIKTISKVLGNKDTDTLLVKISIRQKIQPISSIGPIISIAFTIIAFILKIK